MSEGLAPETCDQIERDIRRRQRAENGPMYCPRCAVASLVRHIRHRSDLAEPPEMEVRHAKLSENPRMAHEDVTWKCPECRTHAWCSLPLTLEEVESRKEVRGGRKYDPATDPATADALFERLELLGYVGGDG